VKKSTLNCDFGIRSIPKLCQYRLSRTKIEIRSLEKPPYPTWREECPRRSDFQLFLPFTVALSPGTLSQESALRPTKAAVFSSLAGSQGESALTFLV
jgi:hypothetical protein